MFTEPGSTLELTTAFTLPPAEAALRRAWLKERTSGLGASDVAAIFGVSPYKSALALYFEKRGEVDIPIAEHEGLYWGRVLQDAITTRYAHETRRSVEITNPYQIRRHPTIPHMIATLDAVATPAPHAEEPPADGQGVVETKNAGFFKREDWSDEPPLAFQIQAQHQMCVTGLRWASIAALVGGMRFFWADLPRNDAFIEILVKRCNEFWTRVQEGNPPDADASESTKELLKRLYPKDSGRLITLTGGGWVEADETLEAIKVKAKQLDADRQMLENKLKLALADNSAALLDNGTVYTFNTQGRKEFVTKASEFRVLRRKGK
jgi:putative phage-type endonuclease